MFWDDATYGPLYTVWFADAMGLAMSFVGAAYVIVKTVDSAVTYTRGLYSNYAGVVSLAQNLGVYELLFIIFQEIWALITIILGIVYALEVWDLLDARRAEAEEGSIGVETPLLYSKAMKVATLCMISGLGVLISGYSIGETSNELVSWFD